MDISISTVKDIENKNHIPNIKILKTYKKIIPSLKETIDEIIGLNKKNSDKFIITNIDKELLNKIEELENLNRKILMKEKEYEVLERTSGVRSRLTWACIEMQKSNASKFEEIESIYRLANIRQQKECLPAMEQLLIHLNKFQTRLISLINENRGEIVYE